MILNKHHKFVLIYILMLYIYFCPFIFGELEYFLLTFVNVLYDKILANLATF